MSERLLARIVNTSNTALSNIVETNVPQRLDRLPWSNWHLRMVISLGITWLLDGLQVTLTGSLSGILRDPRALGLTDVQVGASATGYLSGAVFGALFFGWLTDRLGRKKLFLITLGLYLAATAATACAWNFVSFFCFQVLTGSGIGGEYAAINSAVDELIPAKVRGNVDLVVNATFWLGAALGAVGSLFLLNSKYLASVTGWRFAYAIGAVLGLVILYLRRHVPESPRWLMLRGQLDEADGIVTAIEQEVQGRSGRPLEQPEGTLRIHVQDKTPLSDVWKSMIRDHPTRSLLGLVLMVAQSFFYNSVFFTYGLVLAKFFDVRSESIPVHILPLALGNFLGPLVLGRFFDSIGRRKMISLTYGLTGLLTICCGLMFIRNDGVHAEAIWFTLIFFFASSAASSAYLTVSEVFPLEIRAFAISIFYAIGTLAGGVMAPSIFAELVASGQRMHLFWGYVTAAILMIIGGAVEWALGIDAEGKSLEAISTPMQAR